jgi:transcriptional regulator with XRE-family HTH domain
METAESLAKRLGWRLRQLRLAQGLRQRDLETRGISYKYYQRIEAGRANLTLKSLERLAAALRVTVDELFQGPGHGKAPRPGRDAKRTKPRPRPRV